MALDAGVRADGRSRHVPRSAIGGANPVDRPALPDEIEERPPGLALGVERQAVVDSLGRSGPMAVAKVGRAGLGEVDERCAELEVSPGIQPIQRHRVAEGLHRVVVASASHQDVAPGSVGLGIMGGIGEHAADELGSHGVSPPVDRSPGCRCCLVSCCEFHAPRVAGSARWRQSDSAQPELGLDEIPEL